MTILNNCGKTSQTFRILQKLILRLVYLHTIQMPIVNGMQRILYQGIPVLKNADNDLFVYNPSSTETIKIGSESGGFAANWKELYAVTLESYRASLTPRLRSGAAGGAKKK